MLKTKHFKRQIFFICLLFLMGFAVQEEEFRPSWELPKSALYRSHAGYCFAYAPDYKESFWVAYHLCPADLRGKIKRKNVFEADTSIDTGTANEGDYKKSGFDMGHLKAAANNRNSQKNMDASFLMVNICPQTARLNRVTWKKIEDYERALLKKYDSIFVVTGPLLEPGLKKIGKHQVSVPKYFYKCIVAKKDTAWFAIAFLVPNGRPDKNIWKYRTSIDAIEVLAKIDFYYLLPDGIEMQLEKE